MVVPPVVRVALPRMKSLGYLNKWFPNTILRRPSILENGRSEYRINEVWETTQYQQHRCLHKSVSRYNNPSYEPDGKTTVTIMNDEYGAPLMVDSYTQHGFKLNNGMQVLGPMIIFPRTVLGWDVGGTNDITPTSLAMFFILEPKPDILVIGVGDRGAKMPLETVQFLRKKKINVEILATEHACTTFNFLSGEGRCAAAVMIPPTRIVWTAFDIANTKMQKKKLYEDNDDDLPPSESPPEEKTKK